MLGNFLHKMGEYMFSHPWRTIATWILLLVLLGVTAVTVAQPMSTAITIPGTEAQVALDRMNELFPNAGKGSGHVVFATQNGKKISDYKSTIDTTVTNLGKVDGVLRVVSPFENPAAINKDGTIAYVQLQLKNGQSAADASTTKKVAHIVELARRSDLQVEMDSGLLDTSPKKILSANEVGGVLLALVVLMLTLGSLIAAGLPIATALTAVGIGMGALFSLSKVIDITSTTPVMAIMLGLAVGIDYSLFIVSKYRSYLLAGYDAKTAAGRANGTAGNAVLFAALTVVIALAALAVIRIPFITTMGLAGAATVGLAGIVAVTFIPGLLGLIGPHIFRGKTRRAIEKAQQSGPQELHEVNHKVIWYKWAKLITRNPVVYILAVLLVIGIIAWPASSLTRGLPTDQYAAPDKTERKAYDLIKKGFGAGFSGPLAVVVEGMPGVSDADRAAIRNQIMQQYSAQVASAKKQQEAYFAQKAATATSPADYLALQQEIAKAQATGETKQKTALAQIDAQVNTYAKYAQLKKASDKVAKQQGVEMAQPALVTDDGTKGVIQVIPKSAPSDAATINLINALRNRDNQETWIGGKDVIVGVTGMAALQADINKKLADAMPVYLIVVVGLSLLLLMVAFRSILVPIKATLGFLLSVAAMLGAIVAIFQWGWFGVTDAPGPIVSFLPIILIGILFGLAMDYEFFLVSSMHESYTHSGDAKNAVITGFGLSSKVVTAAAIIMSLVFAGFVFNDTQTIRAASFGLAVGVLVDAFLVRMVFVPAVMALLGRFAWWIPSWLDKILPHVSIEGEEDSR